MSRRIRGIVLALNITVAIMSTAIIARLWFSDLNGLRIAFVAVTGFVLIARTLTDIEDAFIKGGRKHEGKRERKSKAGNLPGIHWSKVRYRLVEPQDRNTRGNIKTIQEKPGNDHARQVVAYQQGHGNLAR